MNYDPRWLCGPRSRGVCLYRFSFKSIKWRLIRLISNLTFWVGPCQQEFLTDAGAVQTDRTLTAERLGTSAPGLEIGLGLAA